MDNKGRCFLDDVIEKTPDKALKNKMLLKFLVIGIQPNKTGARHVLPLKVTSITSCLARQNDNVALAEYFSSNMFNYWAYRKIIWSLLIDTDKQSQRPL